jgi:Galactose oxidase, central domain
MTRPLGAWVDLRSVCVSLLLVMNLSLGVPTFLSTGDRKATPPQAVNLSESSLATGELTAARASLATGAGPAGGTSMTCSFEGGQTYSCGSSPSTSPSSSSPFSPPRGREYASVTYDPAAGFVLLFGGLNISNSVGTFLGDTWAFANNTWTAVSPTGGTSPSARYGGLMTYDPSTGYVTLFGGAGSGGGYNGDCWDFEVNNVVPVTYSWIQCPTSQQTPSARALGGLVYDLSDGYSVLFGGMGSSGLLGDTWTYSNGQWTPVNTPPGQAPSARFNFSMVYDSADGYVLLYGGFVSSSMLPGQFGPGSGYTAQYDTWKFFGGQWYNITLSISSNPGPRGGASSVYDGMDGSTLLFGGSPCSAAPGCNFPWGALGDTWNYSNGHWYERYPSGSSLAPHTPALSP